MTNPYRSPSDSDDNNQGSSIVNWLAWIVEPITVDPISLFVSVMLLIGGMMVLAVTVWNWIV